MNNQLLLNEIKEIKEDLVELSGLYDNLNSSVKTNIVIDKKAIREEEINKLKTTVDEVVEEINIEVIPMINSVQ